MSKERRRFMRSSMSKSLRSSSMLVEEPPVVGQTKPALTLINAGYTRTIHTSVVRDAQVRGH
jgi:hypothetical protein